MPLRVAIKSHTSLWTLVALIAATFASACSDGTTSPQRDLALSVVQAPSSSAHSAEPLPVQPIIQITDAAGTAVNRSGVAVTAHLSGGAGSLSNASAITDAEGRAAFSTLAVNGALGSYGITFTADGVAPTAANTVVLQQPICTSLGMPLDMPLGGFARFTGAQATSRCLEFHAAENTGQQYLVMFENMPRYGDARTSLFPVGADGTSSANEMTITIAAAAAQSAAFTSVADAVRNARIVAGDAPSGEPHASWDFGSGTIYEGTPPPPSGDARTINISAAHRTANASGSGSLIMSVRDQAPIIGDTLQMYLAGVVRLNMTDGVQRAVVRHIANGLVFADDIRLGTTLLRASGGTNTPLTIAQMDTLATQYGAYALVQADQFFLGRYNNAVEAQSSYVTVVHTLMYDDNLWGYTYPNANYFAIDYWIGTDGRTAGNNQVLQRIADDLFMHEISHIRHYGLLERSSPSRVTKRGNQWLTEGFARFTERLPIAMRLLGSTSPSRTSNFVLAKNPVFNGAYFFDDVPTYLDGGSSLFDGYQSSSYIFDYIADQVAIRGGDYQAAVRDVLVNGGAEADVDAAVGRWLPGMKFSEMVTRARVALYTDDYGAGLPSWTQYHQYQLRASRPPGSKLSKDPRNAWPRIVPGTTYGETRSLLPGTAFGYVVDGTAGASNTRILVGGTAAPNVVMSITRIR